MEIFYYYYYLTEACLLKNQKSKRVKTHPPVFCSTIPLCKASFLTVMVLTVWGLWIDRDCHFCYAHCYNATGTTSQSGRIQAPGEFRLRCRILTNFLLGSASPQAAVGFRIYDPQGCHSVPLAQAPELGFPRLLFFPVLIACWVISSANTGQIQLLGSAH